MDPHAAVTAYQMTSAHREDSKWFLLGGERASVAFCFEEFRVDIVLFFCLVFPFSY